MYKENMVACIPAKKQCNQSARSALAPMHLFILFDFVGSFFIAYFFGFPSEVVYHSRYNLAFQVVRHSLACVCVFMCEFCLEVRGWHTSLGGIGSFKKLKRD